MILIVLSMKSIETKFANSKPNISFEINIIASLIPSDAGVILTSEENNDRELK